MSPSTVGLARAAVVITTRNRPGLVREALASVRAQGPVVSECVVVDDGSDSEKAPPPTALEGWQCSLITLDRNVGLPAARSAGLRDIQDEYVLFLDDDDRLASGAIADLVALLDSEPKAVAAIGSRLVFDGEGRSLVARFVSQRRTLDVFPAAWFGWVAISGQTLFRRSFLDACGGWDPQYRKAAEDQQLWLRIARLGLVVFTPRVVLENRAHPDQKRPPDLAAIERGMRSELLPSLRGGAHMVAQRSLSGREHVLRAEDLYSQRRAGAAAKLVAQTIIRDPSIALGPLVRRRVLGLLAHAVVATLLGVRLSSRLREAASKARAFAARDPVPGQSMIGRSRDDLR
jgi:glycosyltransferase involved in cell wall biosynthesis